MKHILALLFCFTAMAQQTVNNFAVKTNLTVASADAATKVNNMAALIALSPKQDGMKVDTLGYYTPGDGGGNSFYWSSTSTASTNLGYVVAPASAGRFIAIPTGEINVRQFGAKGDGVTDDTASIQSAIDYSQSLTNKPVIFIGAGVYVSSGIVSTNVSLASIGGANSNGGNRLSSSSSAILYHKVGSTNDHLTLKPVGNPVPSITGLNFVGNREQNRKKTCSVISVSDRLNFTVSTNNLPSAPSSPTTWPYYGYCFFFSNEGRYIGSGLVTNINYSTGAIQLVPETDQYATIPSASYLLSPGFEVSFAQTTSEFGFVSDTGVDSSLAGYVAINITATQTNLISEVKLSDLKIEGYHAGIRLGNQLFTYMNRIWVNRCNFAGAAVAFPGNSRDGVHAGLFLQGFYGSGDISWPTPETNTWDNAAYRATLYGWYGVESSAAIDDIRIDHTVHGLYSQNVIETQINQLLTDNTVSHAIIIGGSAYADSRVNMEIGELQIRNINIPQYAVTTTNTQYAIKSFGANNQNLIHGLSVVKFGSTKYFDAVFDSVGTANRMVVDTLFTAAGATNSRLYSSSSTVYPVISSYTETANQSLTHISGAQRLRIDSTTLTSSNNIYGSGTIQSGGNMIVGNNKTVFSASSGTAIDAIGTAMRLGADQSNVNARTDAVTKQGLFFIPNYLNADAGFQVFTGFATSTGNDLYVGGGLSILQPATSIRFLIGAKATGAGTNQMILDGNTSSTQLPIQINYNGTLKRVEVGAADSGGVGYRLLRITN